jgi:hypothetical protein
MFRYNMHDSPGSRATWRSSSCRRSSSMVRCRSATALSTVAVICSSRLAVVPAPPDFNLSRLEPRVADCCANASSRSARLSGCRRGARRRLLEAADPSRSSKALPGREITTMVTRPRAALQKCTGVGAFSISSIVQKYSTSSKGTPA